MVVNRVNAQQLSGNVGLALVVSLRSAKIFTLHAASIDGYGGDEHVNSWQTGVIPSTRFAFVDQVQLRGSG